MEAIESTDIALLHRKIDYLTELYLEQRRSIEALDELRRDMVPIANHAVKLTIDELAEIGNDFQGEDLLFLLKRVLRDTQLLVNLMGQLEAATDLGHEANRMIRPMFNQLIAYLNELEQKGYFGFIANTSYIAERIVEEFDEEDVRLLGDNIVTILKTVRRMTQPEVMELTNKLLDKADEPLPDEISTWQLITAMRNPQTRRGLARMLNILNSMGAD